MEASLKQQRASLAEQSKSLRRQPGTHFSSTPVLSGFIVPIEPLLYSDCQPLPQTQVDSLVAEAAEEQSLPPALIRAVMKQESGFKPCAISIKGAEGLMQLMPATAAEFRISDPFDPAQNVRAGAALLRRLLDRYNGDLRLTLGAYNAGPSRVDEANRVPDLNETQNYVTGILRDLQGSQAQDKVAEQNTSAPEAPRPQD